MKTAAPESEPEKTETRPRDTRSQVFLIHISYMNSLFQIADMQKLMLSALEDAAVHFLHKRVVL